MGDFDIQTKIMHVGYSVLGMLVGMVLLVMLKPPLKARLTVATVLGFVLVYCLTVTGEPARVAVTTSIGWFVLGLVFGIGRGEFIIEYIAIRFLGAKPADSQIEPTSEAPAQEADNSAATTGVNAAQDPSKGETQIADEKQP